LCALVFESNSGRYVTNTSLSLFQIILSVFLNSKGKNKDRTEPIKLIHNRLSCNNQLRKIKNKKEVENLNSTTTQTSLKETKN